MMGTLDLPKGGRAARQEAHNTYRLQTNENRQDCLERLLREEAAAFAARLAAKLPWEIDEKVDEKMYNFLSRNYQTVSDRFQSHEDKLSCENERHTVPELAAMLENCAGADHFNTGEIEKDLADKKWGSGGLEAHTNNKLRRKSGVGSFIDPQRINSVVSCVFKDNAKKPKTVTDLQFAVNIPETELIDPVTRFQSRALYLIREVICKRLSEIIDSAEILKTQGKEEGAVFLDSILSGSLVISPLVLDGHLLNIDTNSDIEAIRDRGFSAASNLIVAALDSGGLGCQFLENSRRELLIREYEDVCDENLPDERYQIKLFYFNRARVLEERKAYDDRLDVLSGETRRLWDLLEVIYQDSKSVFKVNDFEEFARKNKNRIKTITDYDSEKVADVSGASAQGGKEKIRLLFARMEERIRNLYDNMYPAERRISEERLAMLENEFSCFEKSINPHNIQPGILVEINLTSIKRKRTTIDAMSSALARFLDNAPEGFH